MRSTKAQARATRTPGWPRSTACGRVPPARESPPMLLGLPRTVERRPSAVLHDVVGGCTREGPSLRPSRRIIPVPSSAPQLGSLVLKRRPHGEAARQALGDRDERGPLAALHLACHFAWQRSDCSGPRQHVSDGVGIDVDALLVAGYTRWHCPGGADVLDAQDRSLRHLAPKAAPRALEGGNGVMSSRFPRRGSAIAAKLGCAAAADKFAAQGDGHFLCGRNGGGHAAWNKARGGDVNGADDPVAELGDGDGRRRVIGARAMRKAVCIHKPMIDLVQKAARWAALFVAVLEREPLYLWRIQLKTVQPVAGKLSPQPVRGVWCLPWLRRALGLDQPRRGRRRRWHAAGRAPPHSVGEGLARPGQARSSRWPRPAPSPKGVTSASGANET